MSKSKFEEGENLIFLISQPRAGSTLTQKILGNHPDVHTVSEPWIMLHPLYALRKDGYQADYNSSLARLGLKDFLSSLPDKEKSYFKAVSHGYSFLYEEALVTTNKKYFLDKTPRYYNIIPELYCTFPKAKFIFLIRNPLAVLCSIINTYIKGYWLGLRRFKYDLLEAPNLILQGVDQLGEKAIVIHYEEILQNSDVAFNELCNKLKILYDENMSSYNQIGVQKWRMGDKTSVYQNSKPNSEKLDQWTANLTSPQVWRIVNEYLEILGPETLQSLGYSYCDLKKCLHEKYPGKLSLWNTMPFEWLVKEPDDFGSLNYGYYPVRLIDALKREGIWGTIIRLTRKLTSTR